MYIYIYTSTNARALPRVRKFISQYTYVITTDKKDKYNNIKGKARKENEIKRK
jgi:hypothetical protein